MLGAIIGDIVGSRFEFHNHRSKKFDLFTYKNFFTDDTVQTCAIASCLLDNKDKFNVRKFKYICSRYPGCGYGGSFAFWLYSTSLEPYDSFGNGAAMRISPVAWIAKSEKEVKELSRKVTGITHNHPEGLKAAEVVALCIFYARIGMTKGYIEKYAISQYPEIANFNYKKLKKHYHFTEWAQLSVPQAIYCFLISDSFEDCLRTTVSIGGDTDTLCAISCAIAEAYYGIPMEFEREALQYFSEEDKRILIEPIEKIYEIVKNRL